LDVAGGKVTIDRQTDEGYDVVEAELPAIVTVTGGINEPRYPSLRGIMQSKNKEVKQVGVQQLGLDGQVGENALTQEVVEIASAEARKAGQVLEDKGDGAQRIADFLQQIKAI
jgi:electron transfer flavoprotein beta subunit